MTLFKTLAIALLIPTISVASGTNSEGTDILENGSMTYEVFEASVPHSDLENCPAEYNSDQNFCRLTMAHGQLNVFVFSHEGEQILQAIKHYELGTDGVSFP